MGHKYSHCHALLLAVPSGKGGTARLAARGALRVGAGLVTLSCPVDALQENAARLDVIMLTPIADGQAFTQALEDDRISALCLGPGLGLDHGNRQYIKIALRSARPCVLDADALSLFADAPDTLFDMLHDKVVLTPHMGEFARLFPDLWDRLTEPVLRGPAYSKADAAQRSNTVILLKGTDTVIASPDGRIAINSAQYERAAPWLATAGSGDVLAGVIAGLLARGFGVQDAAEAGAWLHLACARTYGPGLIAEDLPEMLPQVFRSLENNVDSP